MKTCKRGHEREDSETRCKECRRAKKAAWQKANPEKAHAYQAAWRKANSDKVRANKAAWRKANPEKVRDKEAAWRKANSDKVRAKKAAWQKANPEKVRGYLAAQYIRDNMPDLPPEEYDRILRLRLQRAGLLQEDT